VALFYVVARSLTPVAAFILSPQFALTLSLVRRDAGERT
jgi:hypothetical protein